jgi:hypothetical protein
MSDALIVAGGGGGVGDRTIGTAGVFGQGGAGGYPAGTAGFTISWDGTNATSFPPDQYNGQGGTQSAGGTGGAHAIGIPNYAQSGSFGKGGGDPTAPNGGGGFGFQGGGGGGGYYGGGQGGLPASFGSTTSGGGGSGYFSPAAINIFSEDGVRENEGIITISWQTPEAV